MEWKGCARAFLFFFRSFQAKFKIVCNNKIKQSRKNGRKFCQRSHSSHSTNIRCLRKICSLFYDFILDYVNLIGDWSRCIVCLSLLTTKISAEVIKNPFRKINESTKSNYTNGFRLKNHRKKYEDKAFVLVHLI